MPKYDLAISFAGEQRQIAEYFARRLDASGYSIFYDEYAQAELWGSDLSKKLGAAYEHQARYCLVIVSTEYVRKAWTNLERQNAIARFMSDRSDYILCLRTDEISLPGLPSVIGYLTLKDHNEEDIYKLLLQKLGPPDHDSDGTYLSDADREIAAQIVHACYRRAVFTTMDSEIYLPAMAASLGQTLGRVQNLAPHLKDPALQYNALQIISAIDEIERMIERSEAKISNRIDRGLAAEIDKRKIQILKSVLAIRRAANIAIQLPSALRTDHFYSVDTANEPPELSTTADATMPQLKWTATKQVEYVPPARASTVGSICQEIQEQIASKKSRADHFYEEDIMRAVRADVYKGLSDNPLAKVHIGNRLTGLPKENLTIGPEGEEVRYINVRTFPSGSIVGLFGVWPGHGCDVYAIAVDEKFPEFFGLYYRALRDRRAAELSWEGLVRHEQSRNEELGAALVADDWTQLVPQPN